MQTPRAADIVVRLVEPNIGVDTVRQINTCVLVACNLARTAVCISTL